MGNNVVFQPPECSYHPKEYDGELLWVPRESDNLVARLEQGIPCLLLQRPKAAHFLIFFHANAEDLGQIYLLLRYLRTFLGVHVLAVEYPGYGICSGAPSERQLLLDAETVLDFVQDALDVPLDRVLVMGRSMGGCPAIHLASSFPVAGLVTLSAFSSIPDIVGAGIAGASLMGLVFDRFDNASRMRTVSCPVLIVHGTDDGIIDVGHAHALAETCGADVDGDPPVHLVLQDGADHNDLDNKQDIIGPIKEAFPDLLEGEPLLLPEVEDILQNQPKRLALDVQRRVPFRLGWVPHMLPFGKTKIISVDGEEI
mmetsp:Transcript_10269/g.26541  ORF Transcript_10269/g.26541 Transcript_10269/m.26541 type:complete len:312 (+) Transcript_10269:73-1008(+)